MRTFQAVKKFREGIYKFLLQDYGVEDEGLPRVRD